jgi:hypothetical protein
MARLLAPLRRGDRRQPCAGKIGAHDAEPRGRGFRRRRLPGDPKRPSVAGVPPTRRFSTSPNRSTSRSSCGRRRPCSGSSSARRKHVHALVILSSVSPSWRRGCSTAARDRRRGARQRHADRRAELSRHCEHAPDVRLNATFAPTPPVEGNVAFLSQSGGLGIELLSQAAAAASASRRSSRRKQGRRERHDLLQYWEDDPHRCDPALPRVFGNPASSPGSRAGSRRKPIIAVKSGRTPQAGPRPRRTPRRWRRPTWRSMRCSAGGCDPCRHARGAARHRAAARHPAHPADLAPRSSATPADRILAADACAGAGSVWSS